MTKPIAQEVDIVTVHAARHTRSLLKVLAVLIGLSFASTAAAQNPQVSPPASPQAEAGGVTADQLAKANNPLADMNALNFHNFWAPSIRGVPNNSSNTLYVRPVIVSGRHVIRATIPLTTAPGGDGSYASGIGDINVFDAIRLTREGSKTDSRSARFSCFNRRRTTHLARANGRRAPPL